MAEPETASLEAPEGGAPEEELYEWIWDKVQNKWVKITPLNSDGRRCGHCGCSCPCTCADCLYQCCS
ncbi:MAG: hypothetical protein ABSA72_10885 [Nitrososphaerales archaeon]